MRLRAATLADVPTIAALHTEGWHAFRAFLPEAVWGPRTLERRLREWPAALRERSVILAEENGRAIGFVSARMGADGGELSTFFVTADARGRGVGTQLLVAGARRLAEEGAKRIFIHTFADAPRALFDRLGGEVVAAGLRDYGGTEVAEVTYCWSSHALLCRHDRG